MSVRDWGQHHGRYKGIGRDLFKERKKLLTLTVVTEGHLGLAETNGVLAGADAVKFLELCLLDILNFVIACQQQREEQVKHTRLAVVIFENHDVFSASIYGAGVGKWRKTTIML